MDLQQRIDQLWTDLKTGDIDVILKHFATEGFICLPKTTANSIVPFTGKYEGHQDIRKFFELRDATIQTKVITVESVYHHSLTVFLNVKTQGNCNQTGISYSIDDLHILKFNTAHHILEWTICVHPRCSFSPRARA